MGVIIYKTTIKLDPPECLTNEKECIEIRSPSDSNQKRRNGW